VIGCPLGGGAAMIIYDDTVAWDFGTIVRTRGSSRTQPRSWEIDPIQRCWISLDAKPAGRGER
jgi:hypothetical protein